LQKLKAIVSPANVEFLLVDDGSSDKTFDKASSIAGLDPSFIVIKLARNFGSHAALAAGMSHATGDCAVHMAGDLQEPVELVPKMLQSWRDGNKIVFAQKTAIDGQAAAGQFFSRLYHCLFNYVVSHRGPEGGVDFSLVDRSVVSLLKTKAQVQEPFFAQIVDSGFPWAVIPYVRKRRVSGKSGWTLRKKFGLVYLTMIYSLKVFRSLCILAMIFVSMSMLLSLAAASVCLANSSLLLLSDLCLLGIYATVILQLAAIVLLGEFVGLRLSTLIGEPRFLIEEIRSAKASSDA
jgi:dolichol-phosphate mannosyltransferase